MRIQKFLLPLLLLTTIVSGCSGKSKKPEESAGAEPTTPVAPERPPLPVAWKVEKGLSAPESAYYDPRTSLIFVSNINGDPTTRDGNGYISKLTMDGKMLKSDWATGFNAPKGLRSYRGKLYVADIDEVAQIDIATAKIDWKVKINEAVFLNDIAISNTGVLYVSDTLGSRIYSMPVLGTETKQLSILRSGEEIESPNGLLFSGQSLVVGGWGPGTQSDFSSEKPGRLFKIALSNREKSLITPEPVGHLDGLESERNGSYLVSDWMSGDVMRISSTGNVEILIKGLKNPADIGFIPRKKLILVPEMGADRLTAFRLAN